MFSNNPHRRVIINGDDFGLSTQNNAGIIEAHRYGVLSSASLMVGGDALQEAVALARKNPALAVGLHISFSDTKPILSPPEVSMLVQPDGFFPHNHDALRAALGSFRGRQQIQAEIAGQFREFHATALSCDHVNTHRHAHLHPLLALMVYREARRWGVETMRIPWDPPTDPVRFLRAALLRQLGSLFHLNAPDRSIGRQWTANQLADFLVALPMGSTELYFHPVAANDHIFASDLPTLLNQNVKAALNGLTLCGMQQGVRPRSAPRAL